MSEVLSIAQHSLPRMARLGLVCSGLMVGGVIGKYFPSASAQSANEGKVLSVGREAASQALSQQLERGIQHFHEGENRAVPALLPVDVVRLASLRGSALMVELLPVLARFTVEDFRAFGAAWVVLTQPGEYYSHEAANWQLMLRHWVAVDPVGVQAWLVDQIKHNNAAGSDAIRDAYYTWLRSQPDEALEFAKGQSDLTLLELARNAEFVSFQTKLSHGIPPVDDDFKAMAQRDPEALLPTLALFGDAEGGFGPHPYEILARGWAERDLAAALAWARTLPQERQASVMSAIADSMDVPQLVEFLQTRPQEEQYSLLWTAEQRLRATDPMAALRLASEHTRGELLDRIRKPVLQALAAQDPEQAREIFQMLGWPPGTEDFLGQWADRDPATAFAELAKTDWDSLGNSMFYKLKDWAYQDFAAALAWAEQAPETMRESAIQSVVWTMMNKPTAEIQAYADTLPTGQVRNEAISCLISKLLNEDSARMIEVIATVPEDVRAKEAVVAYSRLYNQPQAFALEEILRNAPPTTASRKQLSNWLPSVAGEATAAFLTSLPDAAVLPEVWGEFAKQWGAERPVEASEWVSKLPMGDHRDLAIGGLIPGILADSDAPAAWEWATSISGVETRRAALAAVVASWMDENFNEAQAAIQQDPRLTDAEKRTLLTTSP